MAVDPRTVHEAMQNAPVDDQLYRQARAAIRCIEERTRAADGDLVELSHAQLVDLVLWLRATLQDARGRNQQLCKELRELTVGR